MILDCTKLTQCYRVLVTKPDLLQVPRGSLLPTQQGLQETGRRKKGGRTGGNESQVQPSDPRQRTDAKVIILNCQDIFMSFAQNWLERSSIRKLQHT